MKVNIDHLRLGIGVLLHWSVTNATQTAKESIVIEVEGRFELASTSTANDWDLPTELVEYFHKYLSMKIPDEEIKEKISDISPVPRNILKAVPKLDNYIKELLIENGKTQTFSLEKTQIKKTQNPFSKTWVLTKNEKLEAEQDVSSDLNSITEYLEQTVALMAQSIHRITYQRQFNIL